MKGHGPRPKFLRPVSKLMLARKRPGRSKKPVRQAVSNLVVTEEEGQWSAHDPNLQGVWGLGSTREEAIADFAEAKACLETYLARKAAAEGAEDVRAADASRAAPPIRSGLPWRRRRPRSA